VAMGSDASTCVDPSRALEHLKKCERTVQQQQEALQSEIKSIAETEGQLKALQQKICEFAAYKKKALRKVAESSDMDTLRKRLEDSNLEIQAAISKTGKSEEDVEDFLKLSKGLLDSMMATMMNSNKMGSQIKAFDEWIAREIDTTVSIEQYAQREERLKPMVAIFANEGIHDLRDLKCVSEDEFDGIIAMVEEAVAKEREKERERGEEPKETRSTVFSFLFSAESNDDEKKEDMLPGEALLAEWKLSKFWENLLGFGFDDPRDWAKMTDDNLERVGIRGGGNLKKWRRGIESLKFRFITAQQRELLREVCFQSESLRKFKDAQERALKQKLMHSAPVLIKFFEHLHAAVLSSNGLLQYGLELNRQQTKAIRISKQPPSPGKERECGRNEDDDDRRVRSRWRAGSECSVYSGWNREWNDAVIISVDREGDDELLHVEVAGTIKRHKRNSNWIRPRWQRQNEDDDDDEERKGHCRVLSAAAVSNLRIVEKMERKLNQKGTANAQTARVLTVARGLQDCCHQVVVTQSTIRESVLFARHILSAMPDERTTENEVACDAVNVLLKSAMSMADAVEEFTKFIDRFQKSCEHYRFNENEKLIASLQHLKVACLEFGEFQQRFMAKVNVLNEEAMECVANCVKHQGGASAFAAAQKAREHNKSAYLDAQALFDAKVVELEMEYNYCQDRKQTLKAQIGRSKAKVRSLEDSIKENTLKINKLRSLSSAKR